MELEGLLPCSQETVDDDDDDDDDDDESKVVPVIFSEHNAMNAYWGSGGIAPRVLDLGH
jgi:hypothetical protein